MNELFTINLLSNGSALLRRGDGLGENDVQGLLSKINGYDISRTPENVILSLLRSSCVKKVVLSLSEAKIDKNETVAIFCYVIAPAGVLGLRVEPANLDENKCGGLRVLNKTDFFDVGDIILSVNSLSLFDIPCDIAVDVLSNTLTPRTLVVLRNFSNESSDILESFKCLRSRYINRTCSIALSDEKMSVRSNYAPKFSLLRKYIRNILTADNL